MTATTPVVILGNGPVGQTTALLLAKWGIASTVLDARPQRDAVGSKAICQQRDVLELWESVGVGSRVADEGVTWERATTFYRGERLFTQRFADTGRSTFPPFVNVSQTRTEELLDERIAAQPLITVEWGHTVERIAQDAGGVQVDCRTADGSPVTLWAAFAVASLGSRCRELREQLGVTFEGRTFDDKFLICDIQADLPGWEDERRFYFDPGWNPGRQVLIHPCPDSTYRIDWQVPGDYDLESEAADGRLDARIRKIIGDRAYRIVWKSVYRFHSRMVDRMRVGRVLLAGDCAHVVSPFGARGLNSGVGDAENAAWKLAFVLRGWAGPDLLDTYDAERRAAAAENLAVTAATMDFLVPQNDEQHHRRVATLLAAVDDPEAQRRVDSGRLAEPFWYVESPLTTPDPTRPFAGRPERGQLPSPAPGVLLPDVPARIRGARCTRIREVSREGLLLLAGDGVDLAVVREVALAAVAAPLRIFRLSDIDSTGVLTESLAAGRDEVWIVRPDSHIAAVCDGADEDALHRALRRALGGGIRDRAVGQSIAGRLIREGSRPVA